MTDSKNTSVYVLGIDPGKRGAAALVGPSGELIDWWKAPLMGGQYDQLNIIEIISFSKELANRQCGFAHAVIEKCNPHPGEGVKSVFSMGFGWGLWQMAMTSQAIPWEVISPKEWQKGIQGREGKKGKTLKEHFMMEAARRWPQLRECPGFPNISGYSGICDAALIAEQYRRILIGGK